MNYYSDGTYHSSLKESAIRPDNYIPSLLLPVNNENLVYKNSHTFKPFFIIIIDLLRTR